MSTIAAIVSLISVIGALVLATSNPRFRNLGASKMIRLAVIWAGIIVGLVLVIELTGLRIRP